MDGKLKTGGHVGRCYDSSYVGRHAKLSISDRWRFLMTVGHWRSGCNGWTLWLAMIPIFTPGSCMEGMAGDLAITVMSFSRFPAGHTFGQIHFLHFSLGQIHFLHFSLGQIHFLHFSLGQIHFLHFSLGQIHFLHFSLGSF